MPCLQTQNVLLRSNASEPRGFTAKVIKVDPSEYPAPLFFLCHALQHSRRPISFPIQVADFGLCVKMDAKDAQLTGTQGTLTHMAPEIILGAKLAKAADV